MELKVSSPPSDGLTATSTRGLGDNEVRMTLVTERPSTNAYCATALRQYLATQYEEMADFWGGNEQNENYGDSMKREAIRKANWRHLGNETEFHYPTTDVQIKPYSSVDQC